MTTTDPRNVKHILSSKFENYIKPPQLVALFRDVFGEGIFVANHGKHSQDKGETWFQQRKLATGIFSLRIFQDFIETTVVEKADVLVKLLKADGKRDIQELFFRFTLDAFGIIGFGVDIDSLHGSAPFASAFDEIQLESFGRLKNPFWKMFRLFQLSQSERKVTKCRKLMEVFVKDIIRRRKEEGGQEKEDLVSRFLHSKEEFSDKFLMDLILNLLVAGRDTTATALSWATYELAKHPQIMQRLVTEMQLNEPLGYDSLMNTAAYPILHGIVWETLRLHPPVPIDTKYSAEATYFPTGEYCPANTACDFCIYSMGRDPDIWDEPLKIKPERWIDVGMSHDESKLEKRSDGGEGIRTGRRSSASSPMTRRRNSGGSLISAYSRKNSFGSAANEELSKTIDHSGETNGDHRSEMQPELQSKDLKNENYKSFNNSSFSFRTAGSTLSFNQDDRFVRRKAVPAFLEPDPYVFPVFQAGPRKCLGQDLALFELKYVLATLVKNFRIKLQDPYMEAKHLVSLVSPIKGGLPIIATERNQAGEESVDCF